LLFAQDDRRIKAAGTPVGEMTIEEKPRMLRRGTIAALTMLALAAGVSPSRCGENLPAPGDAGQTLPGSQASGTDSPGNGSTQPPSGAQVLPLPAPEASTARGQERGNAALRSNQPPRAGDPPPAGEAPENSKRRSD
jgi:hypothetical protein